MGVFFRKVEKEKSKKVEKKTENLFLEHFQEHPKISVEIIDIKSVSPSETSHHLDFVFRRNDRRQDCVLGRLRALRPQRHQGREAAGNILYPL